MGIEPHAQRSVRRFASIRIAVASRCDRSGRRLAHGLCLFLLAYVSPSLSHVPSSSASVRVGVMESVNGGRDLSVFQGEEYKYE